MAYQVEVEGNLLPELNSHSAGAWQRLVDLTAARPALLKTHHHTASAASDQMLDEQTEFVASLVVGDVRKPQARLLLDQMHNEASVNGTDTC